jgi:hypothetical protein
MHFRDDGALQKTSQTVWSQKTLCLCAIITNLTVFVEIVLLSYDIIISSESGLMKTTTPQQHCVDSADAGFTCDDMKYFGYCDPSAGAGYSLAQIRCPKHCGFCV